jgi:hypothetical protein
VLSVPSGEFEAAIDELRGLGDRVTTDTVEGQEVTKEFVDLESRERNLLAAEESLLALYDRAESVEDTLTVERELTDIRGQIEEVQGRIQYLERRTATSEIVLHLEPVAAAPTKRPWSASSVAAGAWDASLGVLRTAATALISVSVFCWWLVPPLAVGPVLWRRVRFTGTAGGPRIRSLPHPENRVRSVGNTDAWRRDAPTGRLYGIGCVGGFGGRSPVFEPRRLRRLLVFALNSAGPFQTRE